MNNQAKLAHIQNLLTEEYYHKLLLLRNSVSSACDRYFQLKNAPKVDLFMISQSVSSPMGKGSDSLPIEFTFGNESVFLTDSAQFGMEPLVQKNIDLVYCYLPSFRGEDPDESHLNQFYHCEAELKGDYEKAMILAEGLVKSLLSESLLAAEKHQIQDILNNQEVLLKIITEEFPRITFSEAINKLIENGLEDLVEFHDYGRKLTRKGELAVLDILTEGKRPIWITNFDIDTVPFYQKPNPENMHTALNADLIFPSLNNGFGGELVGLGQRQDNCDELRNSIRRQGILNSKVYNWYIDLRNNRDYVKTSGFGIGIERFLAAIKGRSNIADVCIYPVLKNTNLYF